MPARIRTLVLDANGFGWRSVLRDTVTHGLRLRHLLRIAGPRAERLRSFLLRPRYEALSYVLDWREALCAAPRLQVDVCNINDVVDLAKHLRRIKSYDLVIVLHSATGDSVSMLLRAAPLLNRRSGPLVVFQGNEYVGLGEKIRFLNETHAEYVCTQLPLDAGRWLYGGTSARVLEMPHALNPLLYRPIERAGREIDIGFVGALYDRTIGDTERTTLIRLFMEQQDALCLQCDIRIGTIARSDWALFLARCKGIIGAESGTYYLQRDGRAIACAVQTVRREPDVPFAEVFDRCFRTARDYVSGKAISSRHFEPIGTKTCQLLLEGRYNGVLHADEHFISIKRDLSNIDDCLRKFRDEAYRKEMVERTYDFVMDAHTYRHRVDSLIAAVA